MIIIMGRDNVLVWNGVWYSLSSGVGPVPVPAVRGRGRLSSSPSSVEEAGLTSSLATPTNQLIAQPPLLVSVEEIASETRGERRREEGAVIPRAIAPDLTHHGTRPLTAVTDDPVPDPGTSRLLVYIIQGYCNQPESGQLQAVLYEAGRGLVSLHNTGVL